MPQFIAKMKDQNGVDFPYSLEAEDLFDADERANALANSNGWLYYDLGEQ